MRFEDLLKIVVLVVAVVVLVTLTCGSHMARDTVTATVTEKERIHNK